MVSKDLMTFFLRLSDNYEYNYPANTTHWTNIWLMASTIGQCLAHSDSMYRVYWDGIQSLLFHTVLVHFGVTVYRFAIK